MRYIFIQNVLWTYAVSLVNRHSSCEFSQGMDNLFRFESDHILLRIPFDRFGNIQDGQVTIDPFLFKHEWNCVWPTDTAIEDPEAAR